MNCYFKYTALLVASVLLAGCISDEEREAGFHKRCVRLGFKPGTDAFANCLMTIESNYYGAIAGMINANSQNLNANRSINTRCTSLGSVTNCSSY